MSTLFNLLVAVVANLLTIIGVPQDAPTASGVEIMQCQQTLQNMDAHYIIKNEQLSQKIN
jgi:hypothetical protein